MLIVLEIIGLKKKYKNIYWILSCDFFLNLIVFNKLVEDLFFFNECRYEVRNDSCLVKFCKGFFV